MTERIQEAQIARNTLAELKTIQADPVKARINSFTRGVVFYPTENNIYCVRTHRFIPRVYPGRPELDQFSMWMNRGMAYDGLRNGITEISEGYLEKPEDLYTTNGGKLQRETRITHYLSQTGTLIRPEEPGFPEEAWQASTWTPYTRDALIRLDQLWNIPREIATTFLSFKEFRRHLGNVDTNGFDTLIQHDNEVPWAPFVGRKYEGEKYVGLYLPGFVQEAKPFAPAPLARRA